VEVDTSADEQAMLDQAQDEYGEFVQDESDQLLTGTQKFVAAYKAGNDRAAKALYPEVRSHWERIETVAESFGDLDPKMDAREADLEPGQKWTGWHLMEKDLWPARAEKYESLSPAERAKYADLLLADTKVLDRRIGELEFTVDQIANGSRGLMEEVATGKVTGEEEYWSRTDLWDFQANVDGAKKAFEVLEPVLERNDPELEETLDERFDDLQGLLDDQRVGDGFKTYDQLSPEQVKQLADAVNALSEPLSHLTAAVIA
jgi:iron uptake system component EfeO